MRPSLALAALAVSGAACSQVVQDPGAYGPAIELVHLYSDQWPTGIAVSSTGRKFSNYPSGLDPTDTKYAVAELTSNNTETPYPSAEINSPPGGQINQSTYPATGANYHDYLIGVQSVVIDSADRLWILDTGRPALSDGTLLYASYGGPKLIGVDLSNNSIFQTIIFPSNVAYPDTYLNDVRFDLRPNLTSSGQGVAYITDSSSEGRNGIIVVDLGTGESWRHLNQIEQVRPETQFFAQIWGEPVIMNPPPSSGLPTSYLSFGSDGIALSADGETLYFCPVSTRYLYSVPTSRLLARDARSEILAIQSVTRLTQKGVSDGLETDSNGLIYMGDMEGNAVNTFDPATGLARTFVRDPRINWVDTFSIASDGYVYWTVNQLWRSPGYQGGVDKRVKPFALFRAPVEGGGTKVTLK